METNESFDSSAFVMWPICLGKPSSLSVTQGGRVAVALGVPAIAGSVPSVGRCLPIMSSGSPNA